MKKTRNQKMIEEFQDGKTQSDLAREHNITPQRVSEIIRNQGITGKDGGRTLTIARNKAAMLSAKEEKCQDEFGITLEEKARIGKMYFRKRFTPTAHYNKHKHQITKRGGRFELTFPQWWSLWMESGKWSRYGRANGEYVMTLKPRCKVFKEGNVEIILFREMLHRSRGLV